MSTKETMLDARKLQKDLAKRIEEKKQEEKQDIFLTERQIRDFVYLAKGVNDFMNAFDQKFEQFMTKDELKKFKTARTHIQKMYNSFNNRIHRHNVNMIYFQNKTMQMTLLTEKEVQKALKRFETSKTTAELLDAISTHNCCKCVFKDSSQCDFKKIFEENGYPKVWDDDILKKSDEPNIFGTLNFTPEEEKAVKHCNWCYGIYEEALSDKED